MCSKVLHTDLLRSVYEGYEKHQNSYHYRVLTRDKTCYNLSCLGLPSTSSPFLQNDRKCPGMGLETNILLALVACSASSAAQLRQSSV